MFHKLHRFTKLPIPLAIFLIIVPVILLIIINLRQTYDELTTNAISRRQAVTKLSAAILQERFDKLKDIGKSLATRQRFRQLVQQQEWEEAAVILNTVPKDLDYIDHIFLASPDGTLKVHTPQDIPVNTENFSQRDWYKGVSALWEPYISQIYIQNAESTQDLVDVAIPITAEQASSGATLKTSDNKQIIGILVFQIKLSSLFEWSNNLQLPDQSLITFVDKNGYMTNGSGIKYSHESIVKKVIAGESGAEEFIDPLSNVAHFGAYHSLDSYQWGVVVEEPSADFFKTRNTTMTLLITMYSLMLLLVALLIYIMLRVTTEQKRIEAVKEGRKRFQSLIEYSSDVIALIDSQGTILYTSPSTERILGYKVEELLQTNAFELVHPDDKERTFNVLTELVQEPHKMMRTKYRLKRKNGSWCWVEGIGTNLLHEPSVQAVVVNYRDISREHEIDTDKDNFFLMSAHQLRSPLGAMRWSIETLLTRYDSKLPKDVKTIIERIYHTNQHMITLTKNILQVLRIEQEHTHTAPVLVDLISIINEEIANFTSLAEKKMITLSLQVKDTPPHVLLQESHVRDVVRNLLSNAIKYTNKKIKTKVTIEVSIKGDEIVITISDKGIGIPAADQHNIFAKFYRASNAAVNNTEGTGLGLFVVKSYVEEWGGIVYAESIEGKGSTFYFTIPMPEEKNS